MVILMVDDRLLLWLLLWLLFVVVFVVVGLFVSNNVCIVFVHPYFASLAVIVTVVSKSLSLIRRNVGCFASSI